MNFLRKNWFWFLLAFILFLAVVQFLGPRYLEYISRKERIKSPSYILPSSDNKAESSPVKVKTADEYDGVVVYYKNGGFTPTRLKLEQTGSGLGCLLKVENQSRGSLVVRLGPYEESVLKNYGFRYDPIAPGKSILIDPRFGRRTEEILNFQKPEEKFFIEFGKTCIGD